MLGWRAEPVGGQRGAELVAIQRDGMRLIVDPRPPDVGGRGVLEEFFFDGVSVEPELPRDGRECVRPRHRAPITLDEHERRAAAFSC